MSRFPVAHMYLAGGEAAAVAVGVTRCLMNLLSPEALREMVQRYRHLLPTGRSIP